MSANTSTRGPIGRFHDRLLVEERIEPASVRRRRPQISATLIVVGLVAFFLVLRDVLERDDLMGIDRLVEQ